MNGDRLNERGLTVLNRVRGLPEARTHLETLEFDAEETARLIDEFHADIRGVLAETELKTADVQRLDGINAEIVGAARKAGIAGALHEVARGADTFEDLRRRDDRGAVDNFPWWKVGGLIILLVSGSSLLIHCGIFGCGHHAQRIYRPAFYGGVDHAWLISAP